MHVSWRAVSSPDSLLEDPVSLISWKARAAARALSRALALSLKLFESLGCGTWSGFLDSLSLCFRACSRARVGGLCLQMVV